MAVIELGPPRRGMARTGARDVTFKTRAMTQSACNHVEIRFLYFITKASVQSRFSFTSAGAPYTLASRNPILFSLLLGQSPSAPSHIVHLPHTQFAGHGQPDKFRFVTGYFSAASAAGSGTSHARLPSPTSRPVRSREVFRITQPSFRSLPAAID